MKIMKNKKGFYFTIMTLLCIILLLLLSFQYKKELTNDSLRIRISTADNFVKSIDRDASRVVYISGYRTMVAVSDYISTRHVYLPDENGALNSIFAEALFNGTLNQTLNFPDADELLANTTISGWGDNINVIAGVIGLNLSLGEIDSSKLVVFQKDPWNLVISIPLNYNLSDPVSGVKWQRNTRVNTSIYLPDSFEDPLYVVEFGSACGNKILMNNYSILVDSSCDTTNLSKFLTNARAGSMYIASSRAPSYVNRLIGNFSADPNGIESLVNLVYLGSCQRPNNDTTIVDFEYDGLTEGLKRITGAPTWIKLKEEEAKNPVLYNIPESCLY